MSEQMAGSIIVSTLSLVVAAIAGHSLGLGGDGYATLQSPYPLFLVLPAFLGVPTIVLALGFGLASAAWSHQLLRSEISIPRRSIVLFVVAIALSGLIYVTGWDYGLKYQGKLYVHASLIISAVVVVVLVALTVLNHRRPSLGTSAAFHFLLFAWLATYATPYMGELP